MSGAGQRFSKDPSINWYRSPVDRDLLLRLMQRSDLKGAVQTLSHLGYFFSSALLAYWLYGQVNSDNWYWSFPLFLAAMFLHGTMGPFMGLIAIHELQHRTVFKTRWLNYFFETVYAFISWSDHIWYRQSHAIHHQATCHAEFDGEVLLPVKFSLKHWQVWLGLLAWNPRTTWLRLNTVWQHANGRLTGDWYQHVLPITDPALRRRHRNWARILIAGHVTLAIIFVATGLGFLVVVFTLGTFYCSWLGFLTGVPQHYGLNSDVPDFRLNTRTYTCSWLPAFYYWNMQYHLEHHMYPAVPFYNLPALRQAIEDDLPPAAHGLFATWRELMLIKERIRTNPDFEVEFDLPNAIVKN
mgnify:FL=1